MYDALILSEKSRNELLALRPPKYPDVVGHHVTLKFGVGKSYVPPWMADSAEVIGYVDDGKGCEAFIVMVNGILFRRDDIPYHITWSIDRAAGVKPMHSGPMAKDLVAEWVLFDNPIQLEFTHEIVE